MERTRGHKVGSYIDVRKEEDSMQVIKQISKSEYVSGHVNFRGRMLARRFTSSYEM